MFRISLLLFQILILFFFIGCREEILAPDNYAGNINEPIQDNKTNYYGLIIIMVGVGMEMRCHAGG